MKSILLALVLFSSVSHADQNVSLICTGKSNPEVKLIVEYNYISEDYAPANTAKLKVKSHISEAIFKRNTTPGGDDASRIGLSEDISRFGVLVLTGKNEAGANFQLTYQSCEQDMDSSLSLRGISPAAKIDFTVNGETASEMPMRCICE